MKYKIALLVIPICFLLLSSGLRKSEGAFHNGLADPSYVYLINSLNLAQFDDYGVGHVDHPGTPLQLLGAIVIKIFFTFNPGSNTLAEDVINRPEEYLSVIAYVLIFLNSIGLYIAGLIIYTATKNLLLSLLFQTAPFISINILEVFTLIKPENFAFFLIMILLALCIKYQFQKRPSLPETNSFILTAAIFSGIILASKISFFCILLIPFVIIPGFKRKSVFFILTFFTFFLFILPAIANAEYILNWIKNLFLHDQRYGQGNPSVLNISSFSKNIFKIFINEKFFTVAFILILIGIIISFISGKRQKTTGSIPVDKKRKLLVGIFGAMTLQVFLVAKHYSDRYMFPALILTIPGLLVLASVISSAYFNKVKANTIYILVTSIVLIFSAYTSRKLMAKAKTYGSEGSQINEYIESKYPQSELLLSSDVSSEFVSLLFAIYYAGDNTRENYISILDRRFPCQVFYDVLNEKVYSLSKDLKINELFVSGKPVLVQLKNESSIDNLIKNLRDNFRFENIKTTKIFSNGYGESLFLISYR